MLNLHKQFSGTLHGDNVHFDACVLACKNRGGELEHNLIFIVMYFLVTT